MDDIATMTFRKTILATLSLVVIILAKTALAAEVIIPGPPTDDPMQSFYNDQIVVMPEVCYKTAMDSLFRQFVTEGQQDGKLSLEEIASEVLLPLEAAGGCFIDYTEGFTLRVNAFARPTMNVQRYGLAISTVVAEVMASPDPDLQVGQLVEFLTVIPIENVQYLRVQRGT